MNKEPEVLSVNMLMRHGKFTGMSPGQALVFRFCDDVLNGAEPSKADLLAIARALLPITENGQTPEVMAEVAKGLGLAKKQGQHEFAKLKWFRYASEVADYMLMVERLIEEGKTPGKAEKEARSFSAEKLGIGDKAMGNRIKKYSVMARAMVPIIDWK